MALSIRTKIFVGFAVMLFGLGALSFFSVKRLERSDAVLVRLSDAQLQSVLNSKENLNNFSNYLQDVEFAITTGEVDTVINNAMLIQKIVSSVQELQKDPLFFQEFPDADYRENLLAFHEMTVAFVQQSVQETAAGPEGVITPEAINTLREKCQSTLTRMAKVTAAEFDSLVASIRQDSKTSRNTYPLVMLAAGLGMLAVSYIIARPVLKRMTELKMHFANSDPDSLLPIKENSNSDELEAIVVASNRMIGRIQDSRKDLVDKELMDTVFDTLLDILIITDVAGKIVRYNPVAEKLLGLSQDGLCKQSAFDLFLAPGPGGHGTGNELANAIRSGLRIASNAQLQRSAAEPLNVFAAIEAMHNKSGSFIGTVISAKDMSQIISNQKERHEIQAQLTQAAKLASLGTLGAGVAHELNNPLVGVRGFADLIINSQDSSERIKDWAEKIVKTSTRMQKIINHLRSFASDTSGMEWKYIQISAPITDSLIIFQGQLTVADIQVKLELSENLPPILADQSQLESIFQNLISNSRDAFASIERPNFRKLITFKSRVENNHIIVEYTDNAGGIPAHVISRIFDPFFTTKEVGKGTGLGLSISHTIAKDHGGTIAVESTDGIGSLFRLTLPVSQESAGVVPNSSINRQTVITGLKGPEALGPLPSVLVIDDEEMILEIIEAYLETDFKVTVMSDPVAAAQHAIDKPYDIIITDIRMPRMSGLEFITKLRSEKVTTPIVVITGHAHSAQEVQNATQLGANAVLRKPLATRVEFVKLVSEVLAESRQRGKTALTGETFAKKLVLVVDDEDFILEVIEEFAGKDYAISTAANFIMADVLLKSSHFDLVLTDYSLGDGKTALDILNAVRLSPHPETPTIVMTGEDPHGPVAVACRKSGASDILVKPFPSRAYILELMSAQIIISKSRA